ncbi:MAG: YciI family protein [Bauldia sp.]
MKFLTFVRSRENFGMPPAALFDAINRLGEESRKKGALVSTGGLLPSAAGATIRLSSDGALAVKDGPFAESREVVGGWAVYECASKAEAIEYCKAFLDVHRANWKGWEGEVELRQIMEFPGSQLP